MKASELVAKGRDVLAAGWCQHKYEDDDGNVCAIGALRRVAPNELGGYQGRGQAYFDACKALNAKSYEMFGICDVSLLNDQNMTTKQDMLDIFDKTIAGLEEKGL